MYDFSLLNDVVIPHFFQVILMDFGLEVDTCKLIVQFKQHKKHE